MEKIRRKSLVQSDHCQEDQKNQEGSRTVPLKQDRGSSPVSMLQGKDGTPVPSHYAVSMQQEVQGQPSCSKTEVPYIANLRTLGSHYSVGGSRPASMLVSMQEERDSILVTMQQEKVACRTPCSRPQVPCQSPSQYPCRLNTARWKPQASQ